MAKKFFYVCGGVFLLAGAFSLFSNNIPNSALGAEGSLDAVGRFEIFQGTYLYLDQKNKTNLTVNAIFRLDTVTGDVDEYSAGIRENGEIVSVWLTCGSN